MVVADFIKKSLSGALSGSNGQSANADTPSFESRLKRGTLPFNDYKGQGTPRTGFVTDKENKPPRECQACKFIYDGACYNKIVMKDPLAKAKSVANGFDQSTDGSIPVGPKWCCNLFRHK